MLLHLVITILCLVVTLYYLITKRNSNYWRKRNIIQVENTLWKFIRGDKSLPEYYKDIYDSHDTHVGTFLGTSPVLVLKDLDDVQAVLAGDFQSFYSRGLTTNPNDVLADNLLFMNDYKRWRCLRQKLSPVFTSSKLKNMFYILNKCAKDFVDSIEKNKEMKQKPFDALYKYTTAAIGAAVFGIDITQNRSLDKPFLEMTKKSVDPSFRALVNIFINGEFPKLFRWLNLKVFGDHEEFFVGIVRKVFNERRNDTVKRHDFIETCLELQAQGTMRDSTTGYELEPTVEVLAAQAFFFFLAGIDSSSNSLHFALLQLASLPDILAKVHEEIDSIFENGKEELTYNDVEKLHYLGMVLSESMRMYPNIASFQRICTKDTVLPGSNAKILKGDVVVISVFGIHRDEKHHPNPDVFDPERFSPENESKMNKYSYLPFGEGNRICIGARFARLQLTAGLAWLLRRYTLAHRPYRPTHFEKSSFSIRDSKATYQLLPRNVQ